jgi:hypothetical protein
MKKTILTLALAALSSMGAFAQGYYYFKTTGVSAEYTWVAPTSGATTIVAGNATAQTNILSTAQNIPFAWSFFGLNVSQFKVSSSGYLTFDVSQTADNSANVTLPSAAAPKLAIFPFWDNTKVQTVTGSTIPSGILSYVIGTAPNRKLRVQWQTIQSNEGSGTNAAVYAINLIESGGFEVIHQFGLGTFSASVGCQNLDGTTGTTVTGSPNMNYGGSTNSYNPAQVVVYNFKYGVQPLTELKIKSNQTAELVSLSGTGAQIKVNTANYGSNDITSSTMNYSVNGGATVSGSATTTVTSNGGTANVTHSTAYMPVGSDAGTSKSIKVWFTGINGGASLSDTLTIALFVNKGVSGNKKVLVEEGSGAWCGFCPDGHNTLKTILEQNPGKVVAVVHHNGDLMSFTESEAINTRLNNGGYPYGVVDRTVYDDQANVGMSRNAWAAKVTQQLATPTPINVSIVNKFFDWSTAKVTYDVKVDFVDFAKPGDIRINTFIIEDKVRGPNIVPGNGVRGWNQINYYSFERGTNAAGGESHPLFTEPENIIGYWHNEAVRAIPSGTWGTASVITDPSEGKSYTKSYSHTMTKANAITYTNNTDENTEYRSTKNGRGWNKFEDTKIVAFVTYYDASNNAKIQVLNATETSMINTGVNEIAENIIGEVSVYPNPTNGVSTIDFTLAKGSNVTIEAVNVLGQKVANIANTSFASGSHSVNFDASKLNAGIYFINVISENGKASYRFVVSK